MRILLAVALALAPGLLRAQPPAQGSDLAVEPAVIRAVELADQDDIEGAIALLEPLWEDGTASPLARATLGALYLEIGLHRDVLAVLRPLAERDDANPAVLYNAGRAALEVGETEVGERFLERSAALRPLSRAGRYLGLLYGGQGRLAESYRLLGPWARVHPQDVEARLGAAVGALRLSRPDEAEELLRGLDAGRPKVRLLGAELALQRREPATAVGLLEPLVGTVPSAMQADVLVLLATAYLEQERPADVVALLRERAADDSSGRFAELLDRAESRAAAAAEGAGPAEPPEDPTGPRLREAQDLARQGRIEDSLAVVRREIGLVPKDLRPRLLEVKILVDGGRLEDARQSIEAAIARFPDAPDVLHFRAVVHMARLEGAAAEADLRRVLELDPDHVPALSDLAMLAYGRSEYAEARRLLERVLEIFPDDALAKQRLEQVSKAERASEPE